MKDNVIVSIIVCTARSWRHQAPSFTRCSHYRNVPSYAMISMGENVFEFRVPPIDPILFVKSSK